MHCLYCGKPLGFLKELTDGEFCSSQHRQRYKKLTKVALARLLETSAQDSGGRVHEQATPERELAPQAAPLPVAGVRKPRDLGGLFRQTLPAKPLTARPRPADEPVRGAPAPSLPGFSGASVTPALGNASAVWAKLDPAPPKAAVAGLAASPELRSLRRPVYRPEFLSGMLRQGSSPALREARFVPPSVTVSQPQPSSFGRDDGLTRPILEFRTAVALPAPISVSAASSLALAQLIPSSVTANVAPRTVRAEAEPLAFAGKTVWRESARGKLSTVGTSLFTLTELEKAAPFRRYFTAPPAARPAPAAARDMGDVDARPWSIKPRPAISRYTPGRSPVLHRSTLREIIAASSPGASRLEAPVNPAPMTSRTVLPRLSRAAVSVLPGNRFLAVRLKETARRLATVAEMAALEFGLQKPVLPAEGPAVLLGDAAPAMPLAALTSAQINPVAPAAAAIMIGRPEMIPPAVPAPRLPVLNAMPVRERLREESRAIAEMRVLNTAAQPLRHPGERVTAPASVLPLLASVLRHGRMARAQRTSPVVFEFEGVYPRQQVNVPLAYMELRMPIRAPKLPGSSNLRIIETFEYLRPLEQPGLNPLEVLVRLWRNTPAMVRLATGAVCLLVILWAAAPNTPVSQVVEDRWGEVSKSIAQRAAVELTDDFPAGLPDWQGDGNWARTWSYEGGSVHPGRLALYRPSMTMQDYRMEFLAQIEKKSVGWVYRAVDKENYYAFKLTIRKPGPLPSMALVRYSVIDGKVGPAVEVPIRLLMHNDMPYRVQTEVNGRDFTISIEGQLVDFWRDDRLKTGGVGFFSDAGERARLYWMKLSHQDDFIGKVCAYFYPNPIQTRRGN